MVDDLREIHSVCWCQSETGQTWRIHYILSTGGQSKGVEFRHRSAGGAKQGIKSKVVNDIIVALH